LILVDSSVWIDFFGDARTRQVALLMELIQGEGDVAIGDLILAEVLQGCDTDREFRAVRRAMEPFHEINIVDQEVAIEGARYYRTLRARGITVRKTIDTLIATRCILDDIPLLYSDRDFDPFVAHLGLRSAVDSPTGVN
jgi:predicted nucleic acid-binding protein